MSSLSAKVRPLKLNESCLRKREQAFSPRAFSPRVFRPGPLLAFSPRAFSPRSLKNDFLRNIFGTKYVSRRPPPPLPLELTVQGADRFYTFKSDNDHILLVLTTKSIGARGCHSDDPGSIPGQGISKKDWENRPVQEALDMKIVAGSDKIGLFRKRWISKA